MKHLLWPAHRLNEALQALVASGLGRAPSLADAPAADVLGDSESLTRWLTLAARLSSVEAQATETTYAGFQKQLASMGPALIQIPGSGDPGFLALLPGKHPQVLAPDLKTHRVSASAIRSLLCSDRESAAQDEIRQILERASIASAAQPRASEAMVEERLSSHRIGGIWLLRLPPSADFWTQLRQAGIHRRILTLGGAHAVQYVLWILAWWVVGSNILHRSAGRSWIFLWALLLLTIVPLRVLITWLQGSIAIGAGARLKQRLFLGALKLDPDRIRHQGAGQLLGRVLESEAVESLALSGGFLALAAVIELIASVIVLIAGAGGGLQAGLLVAWIAVAAAIAWRYYRRSRSWTNERLSMTHDLVENMVGHRTRVAQLPASRWHDEEDAALEAYLKSSRSMDASTQTLLAVVPRGWLVLGLIGLAPAFVRGGASDARIAIAVGGMLLAFGALRRCAAGAWQVAGAAVAWERVSELFHQAAAPEVIGSLEGAGVPAQAAVDARDLNFRYSQKTPEVLARCSLQVSPGDRIVLEGASGGGKSTLVSVIAGLREPTAGQVLMDGLGRRTLGDDAWRARIAMAPQFHENHVLAETFAFNLMMGRRKSPGPNDEAEAQAICRELGLGDLLDRMPAGLLQMVGETGWQLSHGERSRLYIARALLQDAGLVILDESFAALDPVNLQHALRCVLARSRSLLVIAHR